MNRSTALLKSLSAERDRWEKTSETFKNQMSTIAGDCLLSAAFITYAGYFEQQMRQNLFTTWSHHLQQANIQVGSVNCVNHTRQIHAFTGCLHLVVPVPYRYCKNGVPVQC